MRWMGESNMKELYAKIISTILLQFLAASIVLG